MASLKRRGTMYYAQYYLAGRQQRRCLETESWQIAREKLRQLESSLLRGADLPFATKTPIGEIIGAYVQHIGTAKTPRSVRADVSYLREMFGPVCDALKRKQEHRNRRENRRRRNQIEVQFLEQVTTAHVAAFLSAQVQARGLAPKTANRYREVICRLFNWAMKQRGIRTPDNRNPAAQVERYKERAPQIRFLTLPQIEEQFKALADRQPLQTMAALYIDAGLRREEALWLTLEDVDLKAAPNGMIRVRAKTVEGESWQPKTKINRTVPISRALRAHLDRYFPRPTPGRWYFPSPEGKRWDPDNFSLALRQANDAAGLPWGCLDFRHTFGSQLAMKGESLYKISKAMGNSPEICRKHYATLTTESLCETVEFPAAPVAVAVASA